MYLYIHTYVYMTVRSVATEAEVRQIAGFLLLRFMDRLGRLWHESNGRWCPGENRMRVGCGADDGVMC